MQHLGTQIGEGHYRKVYTRNTDPNLVIKVMKDKPHNDQNYIEFMNWQKAPKQLKKWLVPCVDISPCNKYLIQERGVQTEEIPRFVPHRIKKLKDWNELKESKHSNNGRVYE